MHGYINSRLLTYNVPGQKLKLHVTQYSMFSVVLMQCKQ